MQKVYIATYDIFDYEDPIDVYRAYRRCVKQAAKIGLRYEDTIMDDHAALKLCGKRYQYVLYYLTTMIDLSDIRSALKRIVYILKAE